MRYTIPQFLFNWAIRLNADLKPKPVAPIIRNEGMRVMISDGIASSKSVPLRRELLKAQFVVTHEAQFNDEHAIIKAQYKLLQDFKEAIGPGAITYKEFSTRDGVEIEACLVAMVPELNEDRMPELPLEATKRRQYSRGIDGGVFDKPIRH